MSVSRLPKQIQGRSSLPGYYFYTQVTIMASLQFLRTLTFALLCLFLRRKKNQRGNCPGSSPLVTAAASDKCIRSSKKPGRITRMNTVMMVTALNGGFLLSHGGTPSHHPFLDGFSLINDCWVSHGFPIYGNPQSSGPALSDSRRASGMTETLRWQIFRPGKPILSCS